MFTAERRGRQEGIQEGIQKGRQEGIQKGIQKGIQTAARSMLARDLPLTLISEISGLSIEEIKALKETRENHN
jgi:predicted transposase/invertase (TIGR01784 family)